MSDRRASAPPGVTSLVGRGLALALRRRAKRLDDTDHWRRHTGEIQRAQLRRNLERAAETEIGREHAFGRLARLPDAELARAYRSAVPLGDWYTIAERIERMRQGGERDVLWPGLVRNFAQSSGTTAGEKHLPVSDEVLASNRRASFDLFATAMRFGVSLADLFRGKLLFLGGSTTLDVNDHGVRTGDLSGIVVPMIRFPITMLYEPGRDVALMEHWPSKIDRIAARCLEMDVRMVNGVPSWIGVLFERLIEKARASGRDVSSVREIWPNLTLFVHGGVRYDPFDKRMRSLYSGSADGADIPCRLEVYPASEAFVAIQDRRGERPMRVLSDIGNYYEFVPMEEAGDPAAPAFGADEVETGVSYAVAVSTCGGLWRYLIGDVVQFDTVPDRMGGGPGDGPATLRIVGRQSHFINAFGEHVIVEHVESAVADASRRTGVVVGEFTAAPLYPESGGRGGLELAIELEGKPVDEPLLGRFGAAFDEGIKRLNLDYTTKRTGDTGMGPPRITPVPTGTFHRWMESRGKLGGQHKCPRCANTREYIDGLLSVARGAPRLDDASNPQASVPNDTSDVRADDGPGSHDREVP